MTMLPLLNRLMVAEAAEYVQHHVSEKGNYTGLDAISEEECDDW